MLTRRRTLAAVALLVALLGGAMLSRGAAVVVGSPPSVTLDGATMTAGAQGVSPRPSFGLLLPPGSGASDFRATLDSRLVNVEAGPGRTALLTVGDLPQGSRHRLEVWRGAIGPARVGAVGLDFQVAQPLQVAVSWLAGSGQTTAQVAASRQLADESPIKDALARGGATVRRDDRGIEGRWPPGLVASFTVPGGLRATTGAYLPADFTASLTPGPPLPYSRVDLSQPSPGPVAGLRLRAYYLPGPTSRADLARHARQVTVLSPSFYTVAADAGLVRSIDEQALATARAAGIEVEPLVTNQDFSADVARKLFQAPGAVDTLAAALVADARTHGYTGYQLDFEGLGFSDRDDLTRFSRALDDRLRQATLKYSTAVIPRKQPQASGLDQLFGHSGVYDYQALLRDATSMSVMAYDQHTSATDAGPVAGLDWVQQVVQASTAGIDHSKLYLGVPLYYRDWPLRGAPTAGAYTEIVATTAARNGTISWDFASQSPYARYSVPGDEHVVWLENRASLAAKVQVANQMGFAGVAAWRLGLEDPAFWDLWPAR
jgi:spore germination protein YaaH